MVDPALPFKKDGVTYFSGDHFLYFLLLTKNERMSRKAFGKLCRQLEMTQAKVNIVIDGTRTSRRYRGIPVGSEVYDGYLGRIEGEMSH